MDRDIAPAWIVANVAATAVYGVLIVAAFLLRNGLGIAEGNASFIAKAVLLAFEIASALVYTGLFVRMTGAVLRRIVPDLQQRAWLLIHLVIVLAFGASVGLLMLEPDDENAIDWASEDFMTVAVALTLLGVLAGAILGVVQAAVLGRAARGVALWIAMMALAMGVIVLVALAVASFAPAKPTLPSEVIGTVMSIVIEAIVAAIMLPALRRLRPRGGLA